MEPPSEVAGSLDVSLGSLAYGCDLLLSTQSLCPSFGIFVAAAASSPAATGVGCLQCDCEGSYRLLGSLSGRG